MNIKDAANSICPITWTKKPSGGPCIWTAKASLVSKTETNVIRRNTDKILYDSLFITYKIILLWWLSPEAW